MKWKELDAFICGLSDEQLEDTVTVYDQSEGEFYPCDVIEFTESDDVLDSGSMFIVIKDED